VLVETLNHALSIRIDLVEHLLVACLLHVFEESDVVVAVVMAFYDPTESE